MEIAVAELCSRTGRRVGWQGRTPWTSTSRVCLSVLVLFLQFWLAAVSLSLLPARDDRVEKTSENAFNDRAMDRHVKQQQRSIRSSSSI
ncbi:hypothetical protein CEP54_000440 [Fusarium duplospermum]|uniref:Uncharacterized protein n=1 Tax=Fusarium duplospermum TaxID=1325734 RepID=A0A428R6G9_9HYPO|nr:hypothetical protein CEP54_000440 [Fusarium duplospermum]